MNPGIDCKVEGGSEKRVGGMTLDEPEKKKTERCGVGKYVQLRHSCSCAIGLPTFDF